MRRLVPDAVLFELGETGFGDRAARLLGAAAHRGRHLLLRAVMEAAGGQAAAGGLAARLDGHWQLLRAAGRADPGAARRVLLYPTTGIWAQRCLRELRDGGAVGPDLAADLEHLGTLAATAALRAGHPFRLELVPRGGVLALPGLGAVHAPGEGRVLVAGDAERLRITLPSDGGDAVVVRRGWRPDSWRSADPRWLSLSTLPHSTLPGAAAVLDDLDPFRVPGPRPDGRVPETRLGTARRLRWRQQWGAATALLARVDPARREEAAALVRCVVPLAHGGPRAHDPSGAVFTVLPGTPAELAASLVLQLQHAKIGALRHLAPLHEGAAPEPITGAYGRLALADFWQRVARAATDPAERDTAWERHHRHVAALRLPGPDTGLTRQGQVFVAAMANRHAALLAHPSPRLPVQPLP
ncbi:hypothetical protein GCM10027168_61080 [Streptomyces capparidis]